MLHPDDIKTITKQIEKSPDSLAVTRHTLRKVMNLNDYEVENVTSIMPNFLRFLENLIKMTMVRLILTNYSAQ
jgi:hypothetical protein